MSALELDLSRRVTIAIGQSFIIYVIGRVLTIGFLAILARLLTPADFGMVASATLVLGFMTTVGRFGIATTLAQAAVLDDQTISGARGLTLLTVAMTFTAGEIFAPLVAAWFRQPALGDVLRVMMLCLFLQTFIVIPQGLLIRTLRARDLALTDLGGNLLGTALFSIPLAFLGFGYWSLVAGAVAQASIRAIFLRAAIKPPPGISLSWKNTRELWIKGGGFSLVGIITRLSAESDKLIIGRYLGLADLGLYSRANSVAGIPAFLYEQVIDRTAMPAFAHVQDDAGRLKRAFARAVTLISLVGVPLAIVLAFVAPEIVRFVLGPGWEGAIAPLRVLSLALYVRFAGEASATVLTSTGQPFLITGIQLIFLATVTLGGLATYRFGITSVAAAVALATLLNYTLVTWAACHRAHMRPSEFIGAHLSALASGALILAIVGPTVALAHYLELPSPIVLLSVGGGVCAAAAFALFVAPGAFLGPVGRETADQVLNIIRENWSLSRMKP